MEEKDFRKLARARTELDEILKDSRTALSTGSNKECSREEFVVIEAILETMDTLIDHVASTYGW
ncbi:MAG: hypothetical protein KAS32_00800 [Candidatus Peribacteraceae bacterium]|nr:hypothetical protein [Candidatus Peribacteraceae bacterium]